MNILTILLIILSGLGSPEPELDSFIMHDDHFYAIAINRYEIVKLNKKGNIIARIGRRGRGPGEFSTRHLKMTFVSDTLYVYDIINKRLTLLDKNLKKLEERFPKDTISKIVSYESKLYRIDLTVPDSLENDDRSLKSYQQRIRNSSFIIQSLDPQKKVLAHYRPAMMNTPIYRKQIARSNKKTFVLFHPHQNRLSIFKEGSLANISIPTLEPLTLGKKITLKSLKRRFKYHPYFPTYPVIKSVLLTNDEYIIIQTQSYKKGEQLLYYNLDEKKVTKEVPSPKGKLIGQDSNYFYFYDDYNIQRYSLSELTSCSGSRLTFYVNTFKEQCYSCKESFFEHYDSVRKNHIPFQLVIADDNWFTSPDEDDYREAIDYMRQWNVWGPVSFEDDCDECFKGGINIRVNSQDDLIPLPAPVSEVTSKISCVE